MRLDKRVVAITGASSGIGAALAVRHARAGCPVGLIARRQEPLAELVARIREDGGRAAYALGDVSDRESLREAVAKIRRELGPIDLLIANAGIGVPTTIEPFNVAEIEQTFRINTLGVIYSIDAVLSDMLERKSGHIAAISSLAAFKGLPGESAYCASKAAVNIFLEGLRMQLKPHGIATTCVCPGFVKTPMTEKDPYPQPFSMSAERAAEIIYRGLNKKKKVLRFPWQMSLMIRIGSWLPDWALARLMKSKQ